MQSMWYIPYEVIIEAIPTITFHKCYNSYKRFASYQYLEGVTARIVTMTLMVTTVTKTMTSWKTTIVINVRRAILLQELQKNKSSKNHDGYDSYGGYDR